MSELAREIEEIIEHAKGNFFPTSLILRDALVVAKKIQDKEFERFITNELKGYKSGPLPSHRKIRGKLVLRPSFGPFHEVNLSNLDAEAIRKISTAHVAETIPVIEETINFQGDRGFFTVSLSRDNEGVLHRPESNQFEYAVLLTTRRLKEFLDDVRVIILDWAINLQRDLATKEQKKSATSEPQKGRRPLLGYLRENKQWIFSGVGVSALLLVVSAVTYFVKLPHDTITAEGPNTTTQRAVLEVPRLGDFEVFYPKPFTSVPNLTFNKKIGNVYVASEYDVLEQRKDGFKIRMLSIADGRAIEWIAVGPAK